MIKRKLTAISTTIILATLLVAIQANRSLKDLSEDSEFNRNFIFPHIDLDKVVKTEGVVSMSGSTKRNLFFQTSNPSLILKTDINLQQMDSVKLNLPKYQRLSSGVYTYIDSPFVTLLAGRMSIAIHTDLASSNISTFNFPTSIFTRACKINNNRVVIRGIDTTTKRFDQIFIKSDLFAGEIKKENKLSDTNGDAGISTDGMLNFDKSTNLIVYTNFYENKYICFDTNMNLTYTSRTIDNTKHFPIKSQINKNVLTSYTPKRIVNRFSTTIDGYLFNQSAIRSKNETNDDFDKSSIIDVYNILKGEYVSSFYLPDYMNEKAISFSISKDRILAIYKSAIVKYKFSLNQLTK